MEPRPNDRVITAPREGVNDDTVRVVAWLVEDGARVEPGAAVVTLETTKATFDVASPSAGLVFQLCAAGEEVAVGAPLALVSESPRQPATRPEGGPPAEPSGGPVITQKARELLDRYGLTPADFPGLSVVRTQDVEAAARARGGPGVAGPPRTFRGEALDPDADWEGLLGTPILLELLANLTGLRKRQRAKFNRHVPTGTLLHDRWELARELGFGEGTSVYDECLVLGDVNVGRHCWIGPYTVLDGLHADLTIGDHVDIGASAQIYTHNTIERALTGHRASVFARATRVGDCCFIAPQAVIAPGTVIGDHSFVAAGSYVEGVFPPYSYIAGSPARVVGSVEIRGDRARILAYRGEQPVR
jgi:acetyltransferase-like isoleucine patch superfamily enzyme